MVADQAQKDLEFYKDHLEYLALKDVCFDVTDGRFSYSLCMLGSVQQKELHGDMNTVVLGQVDLPSLLTWIWNDCSVVL